MIIIRIRKKKRNNNDDDDDNYKNNVNCDWRIEELSKLQEEESCLWK